MAEAALAIVGERELRALLDALAQDGVLPLLIKGAHLAFDVYPSPDRRPRLDIDLLIQVSDRERVARCVERLGYVPAARVTGDVAFGQCQYWRTDRTGATHTIDVHWRVANPKAFADRLTYDELRSHAVTLPRLGANAFAPSASFALLIACIHRTAHHGTTTRLIWLYDIHLLAARLSEREWMALIEIAEARGLAPVVAAGLENARETLDTPMPQDLLDRLQSHVNATDADVLAFLDGPLPQMQIAVSDWKRIRGWRARARFLREHLFPPPMYVQERYKSKSRRHAAAVLRASDCVGRREMAAAGRLTGGCRVRIVECGRRLLDLRWPTVPARMPTRSAIDESAVNGRNRHRQAAIDNLGARRSRRPLAVGQRPFDARVERQHRTVGLLRQEPIEKPQRLADAKRQRLFQPIDRRQHVGQARDDGDPSIDRVLLGLGSVSRSIRIAFVGAALTTSAQLMS